MKLKLPGLCLLLLLSIASCVPRKNFVYLQGNAGGASASGYEAVIQPDDIIYVNVSSQSPEAVTAFNPDFSQQGTGSANAGRQGYLVLKDGSIEFPILGTLKAGGLTRTEFTELLKNKLHAYVSDPVINIKFTNFKVTVLGEVGRPGRIDVTGDRITLIEAIAQAGDLSVYGKRNNILIVRDNQGEKSFHRVDITKAEFVNSPFYYLKQNDVIYVEPRRAKVDATAIGGNVMTVFSIISFLITTYIIITRL